MSFNYIFIWIIPYFLFSDPSFYLLFERLLRWFSPSPLSSVVNTSKAFQRLFYSLLRAVFWGQLLISWLSLSTTDDNLSSKGIHLSYSSGQYPEMAFFVVVFTHATRTQTACMHMYTHTKTHAHKHDLFH